MILSDKIPISYLQESKNKPLFKDFMKSTKKGFCLKGKNKKGEAYLAGILYMGNCFILHVKDIKATFTTYLTDIKQLKYTYPKWTTYAHIKRWFLSSGKINLEMGFS